MKQPKFPELTALLLAGGRNSRFPLPKGLIEVNGVTILQKNISLLKSFFGSVMISTNSPSGFLSYGVPLIGDAIASKGPLSGIYSGFLNTNTDIFVAAWDMPFINPAVIELIASAHIDASRKSDIYATVPKFGGRLQTLLSVYSRRMSGLIETAVNEDKTSIRPLLYDIDTNFIEEEIIKKVDPKGLSFVNINTIEDYERFFSGKFPADALNQSGLTS
ncbi:MAG: molybdenum cofactor guanylyltransferase [Dissulfurispiraceae bacterium]|jgi:molybdopterin-guanine dinucleotide biosynthesis protein A|nr:molybdenum cofactor guanylyltransferase [Dissulfurispiraceae bacterium]